MCLYTRRSKKQQRRWLKSKPDTIIAYKTVRKFSGKQYFPSTMNAEKPFSSSEMNIINGKRKRVWIDPNTSYYYPYFHLFATLEGAKIWRSLGDNIVRCAIPKKSITVVGSQVGHTVIVTKAFKIIEDVEIK